MERIGAGVIIRGNGIQGFNVVINGMANEEWKRQRKEFEKQMEWMNMIKKQRDSERVHNLERYKAQGKPHMSVQERRREKIGFILACFLCWGEAIGLWEYLGEEEFWK